MKYFRNTLDTLSEDGTVAYEPFMSLLRVGRRERPTLLLFAGGALSVQALSWVFDYSQSTGCARHVLLSIANHSDKYGTRSWPSYNTIAEESRIDRSHIPEHIASLISIGELAYETGGGPHGCNLYSLPKMVALGNYAENLKVVAPCSEVVAPQHKTSCVGQPEPSLTVIEPSLEPNSTEQAFEVQHQNQECEKCGSPEEGHKCPGYLSAKQRAKRAGIVPRKVYPKRVPFETERAPRYQQKTYPAPAPAGPVELDDDYPKL